MRISDWCILISLLGICFFLPLDIRAAYLSQSFCQQAMYEKILDRVCEDSLLDAVAEEGEEGCVQVDVQKAYQRFDELLDMEFGAISEWERQRLLSGIRLKQFENLSKGLSVSQTEELREKWEAAIALHDGATGDGEKKRIELYFPYIPGEDWYQNLTGPSLYSFYEPDGRGGLSDIYRRYVFSGSRIVKQAPEAGYGAVQSGSSIQK